ncbi:MAG: putative phage abortive infection protein [Gemmatimonadetes bacterium]|nr:putative phage abortive infection protein [Gemmatimonadota bacterium]
MDKIPDWLKKILWCLLFFISLLVVSILWRYMPFDWLSYFFEIDKETQFGDRFEAINALFAGLAFAGVIFAIILQWLELGLQRQELKDTRAEITGQKETLQKQNFESSFFQLLGLHNDIVSSLIMSKGTVRSRKIGDVPRVTSLGEYQGRACFENLLTRFKGFYDRDQEDNGDQENEENKEKSQDIEDNDDSHSLVYIDKTYEKFFAKYQSHVGHYFRHLYNVVKFVDDQKDFPKKFKEKKRYTNFIRAQLSSDELGLLFYNCLSKRGAKFRDLVEKYALLEDMRFETLMDPEHKKLYDSNAYGEST